jgi:NADP-dependent 3-hydroxy acid dehydrogenase YdfG
MDLTTDGVYILTGATGGAAGPIAEVFHEAGARLVLTGRDEAELRRRASRTGALPVRAELHSLDSAQRVVEETLRSFGRIDGIIHCAGGFAMVPAHEETPDGFEKMMTANMRSVFCATRAVLPQLIAQNAGFVAGISSAIVRSHGGAGMTSYAAAKGAVASYLQALASEVRGKGIRVSIVTPLVPIDTPANRASMPDQDPAEWIDPREIGLALLGAATRGSRGDILELTIGAHKP